MNRKLLAIALCLVVSAPSLWGWNYTGHKVVAFIAYSNLNRKARKRVNALLRRHPLYAENIRNPGKDRALTAFLNFATWPDWLRKDKRFTDTPRKDDACKPLKAAASPPGPVLPGFPDMQRHQDWHYFDTPFSPDNTPMQPGCAPNAVTQIEAFALRLSSEATPEDVDAFMLPWLIHMVADIHQPLHATARFTRWHPHGDRGGNLVKLKDGSNLHSYWDQLIGTVDSEVVVKKIAKIAGKTVGERPARLTADEWTAESAQIARTKVYAFQGKGTAEDPAILSDEYRLEAKRIALNRAAVAGYRLAAVLNAALGQ